MIRAGGTGSFPIRKSLPLVLTRGATSGEHDTDTEFASRLRDWLIRELPGFLTRDDDKALFRDLLDASGASEPNTTD